MPNRKYLRPKLIASCWRQFGLGLLIWAFLTGCKVASQSDGLPAKAAPSVTDERLVVALVPDDLAFENVRTAANSAGYILIRTTDLGSLGLRMLSFELPVDVTGAQAIQYLEAAEPNSTVGVDHAYYLQQSASAAPGVMYANDLLDWPTGGCRALVPVGLIDSGVDATAPELAGAEVVSRRFATGDRSRGRHGTEVASVLAHRSRL